MSDALAQCQEKEIKFSIQKSLCGQRDSECGNRILCHWIEKARHLTVTSISLLLCKD